jgi:hypothetical protein
MEWAKKLKFWRVRKIKPRPGRDKFESDFMWLKETTGGLGEIAPFVHVNKLPTYLQKANNPSAMEIERVRNIGRVPYDVPLYTVMADYDTTVYLFQGYTPVVRHTGDGLVRVLEKKRYTVEVPTIKNPGDETLEGGTVYIPYYNTGKYCDYDGCLAETIRDCIPYKKMGDYHLITKELMQAMVDACLKQYGYSNLCEWLNPTDCSINLSLENLNEHSEILEKLESGTDAYFFFVNLRIQDFFDETTDEYDGIISYIA